MKKTLSVYLKRIERLQKELTRGLMLIEDPVDLFYLTGVRLSTGQLLIKPKSATLFVDGRYTEAATKLSPIPVAPYGFDSIKKHLKGNKVLCFDENKTSYGWYRQLKAHLKITPVPVRSLVSDLRVIKDEVEIKALKKSATLLRKAFVFAKKQLKTGITELEIVRRVDAYVKEKGAEGVSFDPIIAFGKNSAMPHYHPGTAKLKKNDIVLMDMGVVVDGYASDMTRTYFHGKPDKKLEEIYEVTAAAQKAALDLCKAGTLIKDLETASKKAMGKYQRHFIHSLGHGIGLEVHEEPRLASQGVWAKKRLQAGMVVTIEPGIYLPGLGGVRIEDAVIITKTGCDIL